MVFGPKGVGFDVKALPLGFVCRVFVCAQKRGLAAPGWSVEVEVADFVLRRKAVGAWLVFYAGHDRFAQGCGGFLDRFDFGVCCTGNFVFNRGADSDSHFVVALAVKSVPKVTSGMVA